MQETPWVRAIYAGARQSHIMDFRIWFPQQRLAVILTGYGFTMEIPFSSHAPEDEVINKISTFLELLLDHQARLPDPPDGLGACLVCGHRVGWNGHLECGQPGRRVAYSYKDPNIATLKVKPRP